jgi:hypothetical protein
MKWMENYYDLYVTWRGCIKDSVSPRYDVAALQFWVTKVLNLVFFCHYSSIPDAVEGRIQICRK